MPQRSQIGEAGYTLVELLIVLAILGFVALSAPALISKAQPSFAAKTAVARLASDLRAVRNSAIEENSEKTVVFNVVNNSYDARTRHAVLPSGLSWEFTDAAGRAPSINPFTVAFYPDGSSSGATITLRFHGRTFRVVDHWLTGKVATDE